MISHEYQCIFLHQRKCAGTSICCAFGVGWSLGSHDWNFMDGGVKSPEDSEFPSYFRFSIVRNPYDRFVSGWKYCDGTKDRPLLDVLKNLPRNDLDATPENDLNGSRVHDYVHVSRPQHDILFYEDGVMGVDFVMRFENLQADFDTVCQIVGKPKMILPHITKTDRLPYRHYFDGEPEAKRLLEEHFKRDFELFGYGY